MDAADDLPRILFLVTFVLIGLFRWIANTIAERRAAREQPAEEPEDQQTPEPDWQPPTSTSSSPPPVPQPGIPDQLREFFDSLNQQQEQEPEPTPAPPPVAPKIPALTPAEQAALQRVRTKSSPATVHRHTSSRARRLRSQLADPTTLRQAFLLKEILDEPKALKTPGTLGSF